jgi:hypothetical protein
VITSRRRPEAPGCRPGAPGCRPEVPGCRPGAPGGRPEAPGCRPGVAGGCLAEICGPPGAPGCRPEAPGRRPGAAGGRPGEAALHAHSALTRRWRDARAPPSARAPRGRATVGASAAHDTAPSRAAVVRVVSWLAVAVHVATPAAQERVARAHAVRARLAVLAGRSTVAGALARAAAVPLRQARSAHLSFRPARRSSHGRARAGEGAAAARTGRLVAHARFVHTQLACGTRI